MSKQPPATDSGEDYVYGYPTYPQYVLLPHPSRSPRPRGTCWGLRSACCSFTVAFVVVLLLGTGYVMWPRKPYVDLRKVTLEDISLHVDDKKSLIPSVTLDLSLDLVLRIMNTNYFGVDYDSVKVRFSYLGDELGTVRSHGGRVPARSVAFVSALLDLKGMQLLKHVTDLIVDVSSNRVPIETLTNFSGTLQIWMFRPRMEANVYCKLLVDPRESNLLEKDCSLLF